MAGATLRYDWSHEDQLRRMARAMQRGGADLAPVFADIGEELLISHRQRFADQISPDGQPWEPLSPRYKRRKRKNRDRILVLDGHLKDELRYQESSDELLFGTNKVYGATHHFGDPERGIPARPWLGISSTDEDTIHAIVEDHHRRILGLDGP